MVFEHRGGSAALIVILLALISLESCGHAVEEQGQWAYHYERGEAAFDEGRYEDARAEWLLAVKNANKGAGPEMLAKIFENLGDVHQRLRQFEGAVFYYERSIGALTRTSSRNATLIGIVNGKLARVYEEMGRTEDAEHLLKRKVEEAADGSEAISRVWELAKYYHRQEEYELAERHYREALKRTRETPCGELDAEDVGRDLLLLSLDRLERGSLTPVEAERLRMFAEGMLALQGWIVAALGSDGEKAHCFRSKARFLKLTGQETMAASAEKKADALWKRLRNTLESEGPGSFVPCLEKGIE